MDGHRFDSLARRLASATSRRGLFKGLVGGMVAGLTGVATAEAAQRPARRANGQSCTRATDCASFQCANGFCCDTACTGQCESCATGTCQPVTGPPEPGRAPCPGSGPCAATCDGTTGAYCAGAPGPETSCGSSTCAGGFQTSSTCGGNGSCVPRTTSCAPFGCDASGTACATGCQNDAECGPGAHCDNGACLPNEGIGQPCDEDSDCQSGSCVDAVCCAERCGACQVCNQPGTAGFCSPATNGAACDGGACCDGDCVDLTTDLQHCGACEHTCRLVPTPGSCEDEPICRPEGCGFTVHSAGTPCRAAVCVAGVVTQAATCNGSSGECPAGATVTCNGYACDAAGTACRESCDSNDHCLDGFHCDDRRCLPNLALGETCNEASDCQSSFCVGAVCCAEDCPAPANGTASCVQSGTRCDVRCDDGFDPCENTCCPKVSGGTTVCDGDACGFVCNDGYVLNEAGDGCDLVVVAVVDNNSGAFMASTRIDITIPPTFNISRDHFHFRANGGPLTNRNSLASGDSACSQVVIVPAGTKFVVTRIHVFEGKFIYDFVVPGHPAITPNSSFTFTLDDEESTVTIRFVTPGTEPNCGCASDGDCGPNQYCNAATEACVADLPNGAPCDRDAMCQSGQCRNDTCGCLTDDHCSASRFCNADRDCQNDLPNGEQCTRHEMCQSGACESGECQCVPNCTGKICGDDGCGGSCGDCGRNQGCLDGQCLCADLQPCSPDCGCFQRVEGDWFCAEGGTGFACVTCTSSAECVAAGYDWCNNLAEPQCGGAFICARHDGICPG